MATVTSTLTGCCSTAMPCSSPPLHVGVYLDDLGIFLIVPRKEANDADRPDGVIVDRALAADADAKLLVASNNGHRFRPRRRGPVSSGRC